MNKYNHSLIKIQNSIHNINERIRQGYSELLYIYEDIKIADTPGFSSLELLDIEYKELPLFYPEFDKYLDRCRYLDCSHIKEGKDCVIVDAVNCGHVNKARYDRYCVLYKKLKEEWEKKYD